METADLAPEDVADLPGGGGGGEDDGWGVAGEEPEDGDGGGEALAEAVAGLDGDAAVLGEGFEDLFLPAPELDAEVSLGKGAGGAATTLHDEELFIGHGDVRVGGKAGGKGFYEHWRNLSASSVMVTPRVWSGSDGLLALVVGEGHVGLEEEHEEAVVAVDGALVGLNLEVLHGVVAGLAPGLGEFGVFVAPAEESSAANASDPGCLPGGGALLVGGEEPALGRCALVGVVGGVAGDVGGLFGRTLLSVQLAIHGLISYLREGCFERSGQLGCGQNRSWKRFFRS